MQEGQVFRFFDEGERVESVLHSLASCTVGNGSVEPHTRPASPGSACSDLPSLTAEN